MELMLENELIGRQAARNTHPAPDCRRAWFWLIGVAAGRPRPCGGVFNLVRGVCQQRQLERSCELGQYSYTRQWGHCNGNQINGGIPNTINSSGLLDLGSHSDDAGPFTISGGDISTGSGLLAVSFGNINVMASASKQPVISGHIQMNGNTITVDNGSVSYALSIPASISDNGSGFSIVSGATPGALVLLQSSSPAGRPIPTRARLPSAPARWN